MQRGAVLSTALLLLALAIAAPTADAAKRFGGGGNLGKQRAAPTQSASPSATTPSAATTPPASPTQAAQPAAATPPMAPAPKPSFMSRWGGLLAGLGIGALLASLFGAQGGSIVGMLLAALVVGVVVMLLVRWFAARAAPRDLRPQAAGLAGAMEPERSAAPPIAIGSAIPGNARAASPGSPDAIRIPGFEVEPFMRVAKTSFIRLQAANDAGDLDDIRDFTTPEMYAEIAMQVGERREGQKVEVVALDAQVVEAVVEDDYEIASVRFRGLLREAPGANPEPFDEIWHVRRKAADRRAPWLIAGIQQAA